MRRQYRRWTLAEKRAAVEQMAVCGHGKLAKELGISKRQLYTWRAYVLRLERAAKAGHAQAAGSWSGRTGS